MANETTKVTLPKNLAYFTSWELPDDAVDQLLSSHADGYILSFAKWNEQGDISSSDQLLDIPAANPTEISRAYQTWTQLALRKPKVTMLVSFGGQEYEGIWDLLDSPEQISRVANNIVALLNTDFPVYAKNQAGNFEQIGETQLDGIDFDFEQAKRLSEEQNQQVATLSRLIRDRVSDSKIIALTTYHVGADPIDCGDPAVEKDCSFTLPARSNHHGEVLPLLKSTRDVFDIYNVMAYDAGRAFRYKVAMHNYAQTVGSTTKLRLGMSINQQWGPSGGFVMPLRENQNRAAWQQQNQYGGFFIWALGANTEGQSLGAQVRSFNSLATAIEP